MKKTDNHGCESHVVFLLESERRRLEKLDRLTYLSCVDQPDFNPALEQTTVLDDNLATQKDICGHLR
jgi:hypothetical protein